VIQSIDRAHSPENAAKRERMRQLARLCKVGASEVQSRSKRLQELEDIATEWKQTGNEPEEVGHLSSGEFVAVCLASEHTTELQDALYSFLVLDGWLQRWVLEYRGLGYFAETKVGTEDI
jgi:hypothetical protein